MIAYFTMEAGLASDLPTYSGGLGVLAGDTLRSLADLGVPAVGVTLVHRQGYFKQVLDEAGVQQANAQPWTVPPEEEPRLQAVDARVTVEVSGQPVRVRAWRFDVVGQGPQADTVPVFLLDTDVDGNSDEQRRLTDRLYGGDDCYRLSQETVLGIGGVRLLKALDHRIARYHLNEGHAALVAAELYREVGRPEGVRARCAFTTHTPVPAGHDRFDRATADTIVGADALAGVAGLDPEFDAEAPLDMTRLALQGSDWANGVAAKHGEVSRQMFPEHASGIFSVTNGIHATTWAAAPMAALFDAHLPDWRDDPCALRNARSRLPVPALLEAHRQAKAALFEEAVRRTGVERGGGLRTDVLTLGFARRATPYKRLGLMFSEPERLRSLGPLQIILAGKAHPRDEGGQELIRQVHKVELEGVRILYLPAYDMNLGRLLTSGVDVWLNTPRPPREASGTSGMKAALNGVPNLSILDGWWIEGHQEGVTGWAVEDPGTGDEAGDRAAAASLYDKLESAVRPAFASTDRWAALMLGAIADNGSWFHTHRMVKDYATAAWLR